MELTRTIEKELDAVESYCSNIGRLVENAKDSLELERELEDNEKEIERLKLIIDNGQEEIKRSIRIQAKTMGIDPDLCADLIFDIGLRKEFK